MRVKKETRWVNYGLSVERHSNDYFITAAGHVCTMDDVWFLVKEGAYPYAIYTQKIRGVIVPLADFDEICVDRVNLK